MRSLRLSIAAIPLASCLGGDVVPGTRGPLSGSTVEGELGGPRTPTLRSGAALRGPPPVSGGTLRVLRDGDTIAASDPDHDVVWLVALAEGAPRRVQLRAGDEPGRLAEDVAGGLHVVLRGGGGIASIDVTGATVVERREVCPAPRGIAWNPTAGQLHVACAGGEFVTLPPAGPALATSFVAPDLRDVAVHEGVVYVSRFRDATLRRLALDAGRVARAELDPAVEAAADSAAWRMVGVEGGLLVLSQAIFTKELGNGRSPMGYYGEAVAATSPLAPRVRVVSARSHPLDAVFTDAGLAVDVAAVEDGDTWRVAVASPGWAFGQGVPQVREWTLGRWTGQRRLGAADAPAPRGMPGQAVAVAFTPARELVVQTRAPGRIVTPRRTIPLYDDPVSDLGHDLFHASSLSGLACASCHPEGADDGQTWSFIQIGQRRTQSLRGGILPTAPFHWSGDMGTFRELAHVVFTDRMGGGAITHDQADALGRWVDRLPAAPTGPRGAAASIARGEALFRSATLQCAACHSGPRFTDNRSVDVGTGGLFQVPALLGLAQRAPYMHDGCAETLAQRFTDARCGGGEAHGRTAHLTPAEVDDLVAWLSSL